MQISGLLSDYFAASGSWKCGSFDHAVIVAVSPSHLGAEYDSEVVKLFGQFRNVSFSKKSKS